MSAVVITGTFRCPSCGVVYVLPETPAHRACLSVRHAMGPQVWLYNYPF